MKKRKLLIPLFALTLAVGALFFTVPAYAADEPVLEAIAENLTVDAVWMEGDLLYIEVTDKLTGVNQTLQLSLEEYAGNSEYVSVQAVDRNGNKSNTIQFKNPFYDPNAATTAPTPTDPVNTTQPPDPANTEKPSEEGESAIPDGWKPLTPDGTGTVIDNVTDGDGKEFFTITTPDGNEFYMIIDRQRSSENVYLLNAVSEDDLASLAKAGDGISESGIPTQNPAAQNPPTTTTEPPAPEPTEPPANSGGMSSGTIIFILVAAAAVSGAGYYFKILRPKKQATDMDDGADDFEDEDEGSEYDDRDYGKPGEEGDEE
jgi:hypothetical protein